MKVSMQQLQRYGVNNSQQRAQSSQANFTGSPNVTPILAGNWKMNVPAETYFNEFLKLIKPILRKWDKTAQGVKKPEIIVCTPYTLLPKFQRSLKNSQTVKIGAQNFHHAEKGAYTGEISIPMLKDLDISTSIIGHSERRAMFNESNKIVNEKVLAALKNGIKPILCCGESLKTNEAGKTEEFITRQIESALKGVDKEQIKNITIAYEPIWAIGTGKTCLPENADKVMEHIRSIIGKKYNNDIADNMRILYGGSANEKNAKKLLEMPQIDGFLVGGASLKADQFAQMLGEMNKAKLV